MNSKEELLEKVESKFIELKGKIEKQPKTKWQNPFFNEIIYVIEKEMPRLGIEESEIQKYIKLYIDKLLYFFEKTMNVSKTSLRESLNKIRNRDGGKYSQYIPEKGNISVNIDILNQIKGLKSEEEKVELLKNFFAERYREGEGKKTRDSYTSSRKKIEDSKEVKTEVLNKALAEFRKEVGMGNASISKDFYDMHNNLSIDEFAQKAVKEIPIMYLTGESTHQNLTRWIDKNKTNIGEEKAKKLINRIIYYWTEYKSETGNTSTSAGEKKEKQTQGSYSSNQTSRRENVGVSFHDEKAKTRIKFITNAMTIDRSEANILDAILRSIDKGKYLKHDVVYERDNNPGKTIYLEVKNKSGVGKKSEKILKGEKATVKIKWSSFINFYGAAEEDKEAILRVLKNENNRKIINAKLDSTIKSQISNFPVVSGRNVLVVGDIGSEKYGKYDFRINLKK